MAESKLRELSMDFSVDIINLVKYLKSNHQTIIANQIGRSGTSIGANIHEAQYAQGKKDLYLSSKLPLKKQVKRVIGLNFYIERTISMTNSIKLCRTNARQFVLC